jgi:thiol-disulfide isomerase/thioredoxin
MRKIALAALIGLISAPAIAATAPKLAEASFAALPQPLPLPYNEAGDAHKDVAEAIARAKKAHKLVLLDLGGNWCGDCRVLAGTMALPTLAPWVRRHYEVVTVDVGRFTKNLDIGAAYGVDRPKGVPAIFIVDPKTNKLVNPVGSVVALADARSMTPQALADWLAQWVKGA